MTIGNLVVSLGMNVAGMNAGVKAAQSSLQSLQSSVMKVGSVFGGVGTAVAGMFATGGLGLLTTKSFETIDANAKLARSLGMTSSELAGFQHAANLSGVEANMFGEQLAKLHAKGGSIGEVAKRMDLISDPAQRAAYAVSVFGEEGLKLLPIFSQGSDALSEMIAEGRRMSGVSPFDEQLIEQANDALTRMKASFMGVGSSIAIAVAPYVTFLADGLRGMIPSMDSMNNMLAFFGSLMRSTIPVIGGVFTAMMTISGAQKALAVGQALLLSLAGPAGWATLAAGAAIATGAYFAIDSALEGVVNSAQSASANVAQLPPELNKVTSASSDLMSQIGNGSSEAQRKITELQNEMQILQAPPAMRDLIKQRQELAALSGAGADSSELGKLHHLLNQHRELTKLQKEGETLAEKMGGKLASLKSPFEIWKEDLADIQKAFDKGIIGEKEMMRLTAKAMEDRTNAEKDGGKQGASFASGRGPVGAQVGSVEAYKLITSAGMAQDESVLGIQQSLVKKTDKTNQLLSKVVEAIRNNKPLQTVIEEVDYI